MPKSSIKFDEKYRKQVVGLIQERLKYFSEIPELTEYFFIEPSEKSVLDLLHDPKNKQLKKLSDAELKQLLKSAQHSLEQSNFNREDIEQRLNNLLIELDSKPAILFSIIRIAISGSPSSPQLFDTLEVLGKDETLSRIKKTIDLL